VAIVKLISNWKKAWRMASVQVATGAIAFGALPGDVQAAMLAVVGLSPSVAPVVLGVLLILARVVDQPQSR
jgi:hypothetical protein